MSHARKHSTIPPDPEKILSFDCELFSRETFFFSPIGLTLHVRLMTWSRLNGPVPGDVARQRVIAGLTPKDAAHGWREIRGLWTRRARGFVSAQVERERAAREATRDRSSHAGRVSAERRAQRELPLGRSKSIEKNVLKYNKFAPGNLKVFVALGHDAANTCPLGMSFKDHFKDRIAAAKLTYTHDLDLLRKAMDIVEEQRGRGYRYAR